MIQNVLRDIGGVGIYGAISISLFFLVFSSMLVRVALLKKSDVESAQSLPLQDDSSTPDTPFEKGNTHHE